MIIINYNTMTKLATYQINNSTITVTDRCIIGTDSRLLRSAIEAFEILEEITLKGRV